VLLGVVIFCSTNGIASFSSWVSFFHFFEDKQALVDKVYLASPYFVETQMWSALWGRACQLRHFINTTSTMDPVSLFLKFRFRGELSHP